MASATRGPLPLKKEGDAEPLLKRALGIAEKTLGPEHPDIALGLESYAALLKKTERVDEAKELEARDKKMRTDHPEWKARKRGFLDRLFGR